MTMTPDEARAVVREPVKVGDEREFYATVQQEYEPPEKRLRRFTGQTVTVIGTVEVDPESEAMFKVRAHDGTEFDAWEGELDGWFKDTGQFFNADATFGPERDRTFLVNES